LSITKKILKKDTKPCPEQYTNTNFVIYLNWKTIVKHKLILSNNSRILDTHTLQHY